MRLPAELRDKVRESAASNRRGFSKEVQVALERHVEVLKREGRGTDCLRGRV